MKNLKIKKWTLFVIIIFLFFTIWFFPEPKYVDMSMESLPVKIRDNQISFLTANLGNSNLRCQKYFWKLCIPEVERRITEEISNLQPDIVVFQEILSSPLCEESGFHDNGVCELNSRMQSEQISRLLGEGYTIVCDSNQHMQCIGVKSKFARVLDCPLDCVCMNGRTIPIIENCNQNFTIFAVSIETKNQKQIDLVNVHLNSRSDTCREKMFVELFNPQNEILVNSEILIAGDFNIDLYKSNKQSSIVIEQLLLTKKDFHMHEVLDDDFEPITTFQFGPYQRTLDYIFSNFLIGEVVALGASDKTIRLDGGSGMDHTALFGVFEIIEDQ
jgi:endonuclease/exonuclease/phosphatase family metal-dependent hydrolase